MIDETIHRIRTEIKMVFDKVDAWFEGKENLLNYDPKNGGWSIRKILEHISLANHFVLILIRKATIKAIEKSNTENYANLLVNYDLDWERLNRIGQHQSFSWNRPGHMDPTGLADLKNIQDNLHQQVAELLECLDRLKKGEGILYKNNNVCRRVGKN
jgi:hypothetical protein